MNKATGPYPAPARVVAQGFHSRARSADSRRENCPCLALIDFAEGQHQDVHAADAAYIAQLRAALADLVGACEYPMSAELWAACERACALLQRRAD